MCIDTLYNRKQKELASAWFQKNNMIPDILKDKKNMKNDVTNNHKKPTEIRLTVFQIHQN